MASLLIACRFAGSIAVQERALQLSLESELWSLSNFVMCNVSRLYEAARADERSAKETLKTLLEEYVRGSDERSQFYYELTLVFEHRIVKASLGRRRIATTSTCELRLLNGSLTIRVVVGA